MTARSARDARLVRKIVTQLDSYGIALFIYLGRLYVERRRNPNAETELELDRIVAGIRAYNEGSTDELPHVPTPAVRH